MQIIHNWMDPNFKFFINRREDRAKFLLEEKRMEGEYLGACLDYIRWGGINYVAFRMSEKKLIEFIQHWMGLNKDNLIWSDEPIPQGFSLPHIKHDRCTRNKNHRKTIGDSAGRLRCAEAVEKAIRPSFSRHYETTDALAHSKALEIYENEPIQPSYDEEGNADEEEVLKYEEEKARFDNEEPSLIVIDACYSVISDEGIPLSLEKIIDRLNTQPKNVTVYCSNNPLGSCERLDELDEKDRRHYKFTEHCSGHEQENNHVVFPFCGWTLAWYVQKWHEQCQDAPIFNKPGETDFYKKYPDFNHISSED